ncbi:MAG TPA: NADP-dependent oxidoreductase [Streptosporangiaceae bacterium]|jgi:NADPH:quinone reductase-like Zn-dependent oxidoreductase
MKAYVYNGHGGPEVEALAEVPRPDPGPGQLLIAVDAAGVNPADWKRRTGTMRTADSPPEHFPLLFGREAAGLVAAVGPGVDGFAVGDAVFGSSDGGGFSEFALLAADVSAHRPPGLSATDAATLPVAAATGYDGIRQLALPPGSTVLINGVGGGVGVAAAQVARQQGLTVVGTASAGKKDFVEALGVTHVEYGPGVADRIRGAAPQGIDGIYDQVGGQALEDVAPLLADRSKLVSAGDRVIVVQLGGAFVARVRGQQTLDALAQLVATGVLNPYVTHTFLLDQAGDALRLVEAGHARGKVVVEVAG